MLRLRIRPMEWFKLSELRDTSDALVRESVDSMYCTRYFNTVCLVWFFVSSAYDVPVADNQLHTCGK